MSKRLIYILLYLSSLLTITYNLYPIDIYTCLSGDCEKGEGKIRYSDGSIFTGLLIEGIPNGYGEMIYANGKKVTGNWKNGTAYGRCTSLLKDGRYFEGNYVDGLPNGMGVEIFPDGVRYEGNYSDGKFDGQGILVDALGTIFISGKFQKGFLPSEYRKPRIEYSEAMIKEMINQLSPHHKPCHQIHFHHNISLNYLQESVLNEIVVVDVCGKSISHFFTLQRLEIGFMILLDPEKNVNVLNRTKKDENGQISLQKFHRVAKQ
ncbi:hypothetical protein LPTSP4_32370 [Leptospira ryugenii]|uniref:MORN repeat protein n=1 Tax=Leptospira ryugenii TaxID=1917863 RepID=A0A2P2E493_9LEPT|nr:hypothetical protein [Leptospira ryugenii]GBF51699.1 hypothetical protein LPTSP4_32370 [Leptospira ryugenii]